jgi:hypothetical protein
MALSPRSYLFNAHLAQLSKTQFGFAQIPTETSHMACSGCNGPFFLVLSLGVVGRDTLSTSAP